ncbi:superoxide dismutase family protein [Pseudorhodoferax sp.]|uniref:superoxide dismutase family protein n=1 Tax=Pseudorhodoferax sp. TaxID=1993553 RepID=UPI0039E5152A
MRTTSWDRVLLAAAVALPLIGCAQRAAAPPGAGGSGAIAKLATATGAPAGQAVLTAVPDGVEIVVNVQGLTPGQHGFHIHANGKCEPSSDAAGKTVAFGAAGGHFDPEGTGRHGHPDHGVRHAGDAPNLMADAQGRATLRYVSPKVTLAPGPNSIMGRALVVHADPDDYQTNPAGNSGGRVLCGVIQPARLDAVVGSIGPERHLVR